MVPHEVVLFLELVRRAHAQGSLVYRGSRAKNMDTLAALGWTRSDMYECVAGLLPEQALGVPWDNRHPEHPDERVCQFGTHVEDYEIYIKVTAATQGSQVLGCVVSFHFAERALQFPFANRKS